MLFLHSSNLDITHTYIFFNFQNTIEHQLYIIVVLRDKFQFIRFSAHFSLSFQNVTQISLYSIILQFAMSGFAITTFFQLLDLIIKAIIIAIFCDIVQINYNVKDFATFHSNLKRQTFLTKHDTCTLMKINHTSYQQIFWKCLIR